MPGKDAYPSGLPEDWDGTFPLTPEDILRSRPPEGDPLERSREIEELLNDPSACPPNVDDHMDDPRQNIRDIMGALGKDDEDTV